MRTLSREQKTQIVQCLVEGNSIRATARMTGVSKTTILKLLKQVGHVCWEYQLDHLRNLNCKRIQADEIWQFCYAKEKNVPADKRGKVGFGNVWTWVALAANLTLLPALLATSKIVTFWDLVSVKLGRNPEQTIPLFAGLRRGHARIVVLMGQLKRFPPGEHVVRQGEQGSEMYVIVQGPPRSSPGAVSNASPSSRSGGAMGPAPGG